MITTADSVRRSGDEILTVVFEARCACVGPVQDARSRVVCGCERIENIQLSPLRDRKAFLTKE